MRTSEMIKSKYFRAVDVEGVAPRILTIADVSEELLGRPGGKQDVKCILWFTDSPKGLQLNKTRVKILETAYGPDSAGWVGKRVKLTFDPTIEFGGRAVGGVGIATPPGVVYNGAAHAAAWGGPAAPPGAPPAPVWDDRRQTWIIPQAQPPAPVAAAPSRPPPPVFNPATGQWEVVNPATGEVFAPAGPAAAAAAPAAPAHTPPPTMSQRINERYPPDGRPAADDWGNLPPPKATEDFNDDIPF